MSRLHLFIDGSWLFKACAPERALAGRLEYPDRAFRLSFDRLCSALLGHIASTDPGCTEIGERFLSTSIFTLPDDIDAWPTERDDVASSDIERLRNSVTARTAFADASVAAGFDPTAIYHPRLRGWMLERLKQGRYQEKQVDATVVALLVRSAITNTGDYHAIITGDADVLPAIRVAYPAYSENVFVATTHPDQLSRESRQTSFALADFEYRILPYFLDEHVDQFLDSANVYVCAHCNKVFGRSNPIPSGHRPCCKPCFETRT